MTEGKTKKVVIIENNPSLAESISGIFANKQYETIHASNGLDGIESVYETGPNLVILNPAISDINGFCVYKLLKDNPKTSEIPILIVADNEKDMLRFLGIRPQIEHNLIRFTSQEEFEANIEHAIESIEERTQSSRFQEQSKEFRLVLENLAKAYHQAGQSLAAKEMEGMLAALLGKITAMLNTEHGSLMLVDEDSRELVIKAAKGLSEEVVNKTRIKVGSSISGWVAKANSPLLIYDVEKDERFLRENNGRYYTRSLLSAPIRVEEKVIGVINVNNKLNREPFNEYDLSLISVLANDISIAIESSHLQKQLVEANTNIGKLKNTKQILTDVIRSLDDEIYELTISQEVSNIIYSRLDYKEIVNAILEIIERSLDCHICGLLFLDEEKRTEIIVEIKYPTTQEEIDRFKLQMVETFNRLTGGKLLQEQVAVSQTNGSQIVDSVTDSRNILSSYHANLLLAGERPIGLLAASNSFPGAFNSADLRIFSIIARHSSVALNNTLLHKKIKELSITDGLTGLYVYRYFNEAIEKEIARAARYEKPMGLIMLDLDGFKRINDTYGHLQGDEVLKEVAGVFKRICREVDIIARYGGEEFVIILPEADIEGAFAVADRIRMVIKNYAFGTKEKRVSITASIGVASYPECATTRLDLIKEVDRALYHAKAEGKNKVCRAVKELKE